jgi:putative transposase
MPGHIWHITHRCRKQVFLQKFSRDRERWCYWEDRYFATAMDADDYLARCLIYIDMNIVRAGVVTHPGKWKHSAYHEIQSPPKRYRIIDRIVLASH